MEMKWVIEAEDIQLVRQFIDSRRDSKFVQHRIRRNVSDEPCPFSRDNFWFVMLGCLMTTQQRSGPDSAVARFLRARPFLLSLPACRELGVGYLVEQKLSEFGGIRRAPTIAEHAATNYRWLEAEGWKLVAEQYANLLEQRTRAPEATDIRVERMAASFIDAKLVGFGPKQARNLWQWLGLTRYEITLDGRVTKWLTDNVLRQTLSATLLADSGYYEFVLDGIQSLCHEAGFLPYVFDAAIFSSVDREWKESELDDFN